MSAVELCATTSVPVSPCSKTTLEPSDASTIVVKRRGIHTFLIAILHRDIRNDFFSSDSLLFPITI